MITGNCNRQHRDKRFLPSNFGFLLPYARYLSRPSGWPFVTVVGRNTISSHPHKLKKTLGTYRSQSGVNLAETNQMKTTATVAPCSKFGSIPSAHSNGSLDRATRPRGVPMRQLRREATYTEMWHLSNL